MADARLRNTNSGAVISVPTEKAARMGSEWVPAGDAPTGGYADMTVPELKDEIRTRNEGRDDDALPLTGSKADLIAALEADD